MRKGMNYLADGNIRKRKSKITFLTATLVEHSVSMYEGDYVIRDVDAHIYGYPYVILLGRIPYTHYFRERYECLDYSIVKIVNTKTRDFYCAADDSDTEG